MEQHYGPPQPPKKSYTGLIIGLVIASIALVCVCGGVFAVTSGGGGSTSENPTPPDDAVKIAKIGESARDGKFEFTVTKVKTGVKNVGGEWGSDAQGEYTLVTIKVKNIGDEAQMFDDSNLYAFDPKGRKYEADGAAGIYANKGGEAFLNDINPGNEVIAVIVFDVAAGTKLVKIELHDSAFSGGVVVKL